MELEPKFIGRENELNKLKSYFESILKGKGKTVFITGESGIGKTRFVTEFGKFAKAKNAIYVRGACPTAIATKPYSPFIDITKEICTNYTTKKDYNAIELCRELGKLFGIEKIVRKTDQRQTIDIKEEKEQLLSTFLALLKTISTKPVVLFIDNLTWADSGSLQLFLHLSDNITNLKVLLIGAYRPEEMEEAEGKHRPIAELLQQMVLKGTYTAISLERFTISETSEMISSMFASAQISNEFADKIFKESEGNPFFIREIIKSLVSEKIIDLKTKDWYKKLDLSKIKIPRTVQTLISERLNMLSKENIKVLAYAAVIGREFEFNLLQRVSKIEKERLQNILTALIEDKWIYEDISTEGNYRFDHAKVQEIVYNSLGARKQTLHNEIGKAMELLYSERLNEVVYRLAKHFYFGGNFDKSIFYSIEAARKSVRANAPEEGLNYYTQALLALEKMKPHAENLNKHIEVLCDTGELEFNIGKWDEALNHFNLMLNLSQKMQNKKGISGAYRNLAHVYRLRGEYEKAIENYEKSIELSSAIKDVYGIADCYRGLGYVSWRRSEYKNAHEYFGKCIKTAEKLKDLGLIGISYLETGNVYNEEGNLERAIRFYKKSSKILQQVGNIRDIGRAYNNIGDVYLQKKEWSKALRYFDMCKATAEKTGNKNMVGWALFNAGEALAKGNNPDKAIEYCQKSLKILTELNDRIGISAVYRNLGTAYGFKKDWQNSIQYFNNSIEILEKINSPYNLANTYFEMGLMYASKKDFENANAYLTQALKILEKLEAKKLTDAVRVELKRLRQK